MYDPWENLLETAKKVHLYNSKLQDFCPFPNDIKKQTLKPFHIPASDLMQNETGLLTDEYAELRDAIISASPYACLLYTSPSPRDATTSRMPSSA